VVMISSCSRIDHGEGGDWMDAPGAVRSWDDDDDDDGNRNGTAAGRDSFGSGISSDKCHRLGHNSMSLSGDGCSLVGQVLGV
jgi:hypothetical protein